MLMQADAVRLRETLRRLSDVVPFAGLLKRAAALGVGSTPHRVILRENKLQLLAYDPPGGVRVPVPIVMVPSLINRHYILDLVPDKSLVAFLTSQGFAVTLLDWGVPSDEDRFIDLDRCISSAMRRAVRATRREFGCRAVVLVGYCLGGTMAAAYAARYPQDVAALVALTTPVDFHDTGLLSVWSRARTSDPGLMAQALGNIPWYVLQASFQMLRPTLPLSKAVGLSQRVGDEAFVDSVLALETWGNDNVALPGAYYVDLIDKLYRQNALAAGTLEVAGRRVRLADLTCPVLNVVAEQDNIVPRTSSGALTALCGSADAAEWVAPGGHIGAIISRKASAELWPRLATWLTERLHA